MKKSLLIFMLLLVTCLANRRWVPPRFANLGTEVHAYSVYTNTTTGASVNVSVTVPAGLEDGAIMISHWSNHTAGQVYPTFTFDGTTVTNTIYSVVGTNGSRNVIGFSILPIGNKAAGSYTFNIATTGTMTGTYTTVQVLGFVNQTTPYAGLVSGSAWGGTRTLTPSSAIGDKVYMGFNHQVGTATVGANQTDLIPTTSGGTFHASYKVATTPTTTISYTLGSTTNTMWAGFAVQYQP